MKRAVLILQLIVFVLAQVSGPAAWAKPSDSRCQETEHEAAVSSFSVASPNEDCKMSCCPAPAAVIPNLSDTRLWGPFQGFALLELLAPTTPVLKQDPRPPATRAVFAFHRICS